MEASLIDENARIKVSSTLDKSVGKKHLTDGSLDTCWTSQAGLPQSITVIFSALVVPHKLALTFQGGFVGAHCELLVSTSSSPSSADWSVLESVYPEDTNHAQNFTLSPTPVPVHALKLVFHQSTDFFGRITLYDMRVLGAFA